MKHRPFETRHIGGAALALCLAGSALFAGQLAAKPAAKPAAKHAAKPAAKPAALAPAVNVKQICVEVESGKITPAMQLFKDSECSGGSGMEIPEGANPKVKEGEAVPKFNGEDTISFTSGAGTYKVWLRAWWMDGCGNSFGVSFDGGRQATITDGNYKRWHWVPGPKVTLTAGKHTLVLHNTEDGAKADQVFLTQDAERVPVGKEKVNQ